VALGATALLGVGGWYVWNEVNVPDLPVLYVVPQAPQLEPAPGEALYRVHPTRSEVTYEIEEILAGVSTTTTGSTQGIAGDVALNASDPSASRFGEIVVDVSQLTSDQSLRDRRIRHDFLESGNFPLARFAPSAVSGLPDAVADDTAYDVAIDGDLTVKETTAPVTLEGTATQANGELRLEAATTTRLSTFDAGPIELLGFVRTSDEVTLRFDITFVDPGRVALPTATRGPEVALAATGDGPSFANDIQPILTNYCATCHNDGGVGAMVWGLNTAGDAAEIASGLELVVGTGFMPPWPASDLSAEFLHDRSLDPAQVDAVVAWARAGGPLDVDPDMPIVAPPPMGPTIRADAVVTPAEPYQGSPAIRDDYRCQVYDPNVDDTTWVSGYEFVADRTEIVHHAIGRKVPAAMRDDILAADAAAEGAGFPCIADIGAGMSTQFLAWAPGQEPTRYPEGTALRLDPGDLLVLQIHYHYAHPAPADLSALHLEYTDPAGGTPREVRNEILLAPAEIPCRPGLEEGPLCDRDAALADVAERFGPALAFIPNGLARRCGADLDAMMAVTDGRASASCVHTMRSDVEAISVFGHMHEIGESFRMTLNPGTAQEQVLLDIPVWDFAWQLNFPFAEPVQVRAGDKVLVECTWNRVHLGVPEARYITWAEGTRDEMCFSGLTVVPARE
jgi:polyisoprenoid-binding protein YceI